MTFTNESIDVVEAIDFRGFHYAFNRRRIFEITLRDELVHYCSAYFEFLQYTIHITLVYIMQKKCQMLMQLNQILGMLSIPLSRVNASSGTHAILNYK